MEEPTSFTILESAFLNDVVEEFATTGVLHDQEELLGSLNDLVELDDIGVPDDFQNVDLSHHSSDVCLVLDLVLFQNFDRHFLLRQLVDALSNLTESA